MKGVKIKWIEKRIRFGIQLSGLVRLNLIGLLLLFSFQSGAQQIIWEKYWPNIKATTNCGSSGGFDAVVVGDSGYYFAVGNLAVVHHFNLAPAFRDTLSGVVVVKLNADGDTIWCKKVADNPGSKCTTWLKSNGNGSLTVVYRTGAWVSEYRLVLVTESTGASFAWTTIPETYWYANNFGTDPEGNIYIMGERNKVGVSNQYEMVCVKVKADGSIGYINGYSPNNFPISAAQYIEPMPGGKMRMSGNKGKTIVAYELNADGSVADYKEYMDNPYNYVQQDGAYVQQSDSGYFLVSVGRFSGAPSNANVRGAVAKMDRNGSFVWHGYRARSGTKPWPLLDGGYAITTWNTSIGYFQRYSGDSTLLWEVNHSSGINQARDFTGMLFESNEGLAYGVLSTFGGSLSGQFPYLLKIANVGYPVDPTNPIPPVVGVKEQKKRAEISYAVPNPTTGIFHVLGMGSGHFRMVDAQGRTVMEAEHKGGDAIDVSALPCGVYTYTLVTKGSRTEGRIVRE